MNERKTGITGRMAELYDVFVDWPGRLSRELPGLRSALEEADARKVLDVGCGTGQHALALRDAGYDVIGADASDDMLERARRAAGETIAFHRWRLGDPAPAALREAAPFDAITCLGNVWPQLITHADLQNAMAELQALLREGGLFLAGMKAVAWRRETKNPYMPLLKRHHEGHSVFFVRFVDFDRPGGDDGVELCDFHMVVVRGGSDPDGSSGHHGMTEQDGSSGQDQGGEHDGISQDHREAAPGPNVESHRVSPVRVWSSEQLRRAFVTGGFTEVQVSASLADPQLEAQGEDVFVHARKR